MKRKNKSYILAGVMAGALVMPIVTACSSSFLDEKLTTERNMDYFNTDEGVQALATGLYYDLRWHFAFEWGYTMQNYGTDEFTVGADGSNGMWNDYITNLGADITTVNINTTHAYDLWDAMYTDINAANLLLEKLEAYQGSDKSQLTGVAHFIRAFDYFKLVTQYGGVPLKLTATTEKIEKEFTRSTAQEVINQVLSDLESAYTEITDDSSNDGHITKSAVAHFLAKAYLWRASEINDSWNASTKSADLDKVIQYATVVINKHPLAANFADLWNYTKPDGDNENLPEIVLSAQFTTTEASKPNYGNSMLLYFTSQYKDLPGMQRDIPGEREYNRLRSTYYAYNVFDHVNDSRMWKSFRTKLRQNNTLAGHDLGDVAVMFILNKPGDSRFSAVRNNEVGVDAESGKKVPTTFVEYPSGTTSADKPLEDDAYIKYFAPCSKWVDGSRSTINEEKGNRDGILARSAEDYFFIAEAYIRKGDYASATKYLNIIRERAQWKVGENREEHVNGGAAWNESALGWNVFIKQQGIGSYINRSTYYESNNLPLGSLDKQSSHLDVSDISQVDKLPAEDQAIVKKLGLSSQYDVAMCFLLNEKTREMFGELVRWVDLARTKTLVSRAKAFNKDAAPNIDEHHLLRPIPQTYLDAIQKDGKALTSEEKAAQQNPGY